MLKQPFANLKQATDADDLVVLMGTDSSLMHGCLLFGLDGVQPTLDAPGSEPWSFSRFHSHCFELKQSLSLGSLSSTASVRMCDIPVRP